MFFISHFVLRFGCINTVLTFLDYCQFNLASQASKRNSTSEAGFALSDGFLMMGDEWSRPGRSRNGPEREVLTGEKPPVAGARGRTETVQLWVGVLETTLGGGTHQAKRMGTKATGIPGVTLAGLRKFMSKL